jgi:hypothetical protein
MDGDTDPRRMSFLTCGDASALQRSAVFIEPDSPHPNHATSAPYHPSISLHAV